MLKPININQWLWKRWSSYGKCLSGRMLDIQQILDADSTENWHRRKFWNRHSMSNSWKGTQNLPSLHTKFLSIHQNAKNNIKTIARAIDIALTNNSDTTVWLCVRQPKTVIILVMVIFAMTKRDKPLHVKPTMLSSQRQHGPAITV